jgi:predicted RNA-binding Zn ribbon-like protein
MRYTRRVSVRVHPLGLSELVALVNGWGTQPRQAGHRAAPPLSAVLVGTLRAGSDPTAVADRLHAVFAAGDAVERARLVTAMLAETAVRPEVAQDDDVLAAAWSVPEPRTALLASAALALREHLAADPDRLGVCADQQCADVYIDASPGGHRRFCSLTCQNRTRVAAFRQRRRNADARGID